VNNAVADVARGTVDALRIGQGIDYAFNAPDENVYGRIAFALMDVQRATVIFSTLAGPFAGRVGSNSAAIDSCPLPYSKGRPPYAPGQVDTVWENAKTPSGKVFDPYTGEELFWDETKPRNGQWDMGHKRGLRYDDYHKDYLGGKISKDKFLEIHQNPGNYQPRSVYSNRSRRWD
jgi:hypothetical protein